MPGIHVVSLRLLFVVFNSTTPFALSVARPASEVEALHQPLRLRRFAPKLRANGISIYPDRVCEFTSQLDRENSVFWRDAPAISCVTENKCARSRHESQNHHLPDAARNDLGFIVSVPAHYCARTRRASDGRFA